MSDASRRQDAARQPLQRQHASHAAWAGDGVGGTGDGDGDGDGVLPRLLPREALQRHAGWRTGNARPARTAQSTLQAARERNTSRDDQDGDEAAAGTKRPRHSVQADSTAERRQRPAFWAKRSSASHGADTNEDADADADADDDDDDDLFTAGLPPITYVDDSGLAAGAAGTQTAPPTTFSSSGTCTSLIAPSASLSSRSAPPGRTAANGADSDSTRPYAAERHRDNTAQGAQESEWLAPARCLPVGTLAPRTVVRNMQRNLGVHALFPAQATILRHMFATTDPADPDDVLISAPTGTGKTLMYALPMICDLAQCVVRPRLRALVLVPTRDLAAQAVHMLSALTTGAPHRNDGAPRDDTDRAAHSGSDPLHAARNVPVRVGTAVGGPGASFVDERRALPRLDVLVATPGRLVDHLERGTTELTLQHLRWLVIDETDRLLQQMYQDWASRVLALAGQRRGGERGALPTAMFDPPLRPMRKVLLSATQTRNPKRLAALHLHRPTYFAYRPSSRPGGPGARQHDGAEQRGVRHLFTAPAQLRSVAAVCVNEADKLPLLLYLMRGASNAPARHQNDSGRALLPLPPDATCVVFAKSVDAAHRLARFLQLALPASMAVAEFSKHTPADARGRTLDRLRRRELRAVVCSDVVARGIDVSGVDCVVNYDVPAHVKTYVHRVGRTARAGRHGETFTFVLGHQVKHFREQIVRRVDERREESAGGDGHRTKFVEVRKRSGGGAEFAALLPELSDECAARLAELKAVLRQEQIGVLMPTGALSACTRLDVARHCRDQTDADDGAAERPTSTSADARAQRVSSVRSRAPREHSAIADGVSSNGGNEGGDARAQCRDGAAAAAAATTADNRRVRAELHATLRCVALRSLTTPLTDAPASHRPLL